MEATSNALFSIGPLEVTKTVVTMWVIIVVLGLVSWLATRRLKMVPGPIQSAAEMAVTKLQDYFTGTMGRDNARRYFPVMATFFIFIVVSNYSGILPGAGHGFAVPTANLSTTAGLAIIAFFTTHIVGVKRRGVLGYLKTFISPFILMLPLNLIEQVVRPFSPGPATVRQYLRRGNGHRAAQGHLPAAAAPYHAGADPAVLPDPGGGVHHAAVHLH